MNVLMVFLGGIIVFCAYIIEKVKEYDGLFILLAIFGLVSFAIGWLIGAAPYF
jgi:hypothetical protein